MKGLLIMDVDEERIPEAIARAVQTTKSTRPALSALVNSLRVSYDANSDEPCSLSILTHLHAWSRTLLPGIWKDYSTEQIADNLIGWVEKAIEAGFLAQENLPLHGPVDPQSNLVALMKARRAETSGGG